MTLPTEAPLVDETPPAEQVAVAPRRRRLRRPRFRAGKLLVRRLIAVGIILAVLWAAYWFIMHSPYGIVAREQIMPVYNSAAALINDPLRIDWGGQLMVIGAFVMGHLGFILFLFDER